MVIDETRSAEDFFFSISVAHLAAVNALCFDR
jgi:hypothetical protein